MKSWVKRGSAGVADQVLSSGTNFATAFVASAVLDVGTFGSFIVSIAIVIFFLSVQRAFVGIPLLSRLSSTDPAQRPGLISDAVSAALWLGLLGTLVGIVAWSSGLALVQDLIWLAPWLPAILVQDAGRYAYLSARRPGGALILDTVWAVVQAAILVAVIVSDNSSPASLSMAWGAAALVSAIWYCRAAGSAPWLGRPARWLRASAHISRWVAPTTIMTQTRINGTLILVGGILGVEAAAGLRVIQLLVAQPVQTFLNAMMVLLVPTIARWYARRDFALLRRRVAQLSLLFGIASLLVFVLVPVRYPLLELLFPKYVDAADLVLPLCVQIAFMAASLPAQAVARGLERPAGLLLVQLLVTGVSVAGSVAIGIAWGPVGVAWSLAAGSMLMWVGTALVRRRAVREAESAPAPEAASVPRADGSQLGGWSA